MKYDETIICNTLLLRLIYINHTVPRKFISEVGWKIELYTDPQANRYSKALLHKPI